MLGNFLLLSNFPHAYHKAMRDWELEEMLNTSLIIRALCLRLCQGHKCLTEPDNMSNLPKTSSFPVIRIINQMCV